MTMGTRESKAELAAKVAKTTRSLDKIAIPMIQFVGVEAAYKEAVRQLYARQSQQPREDPQASLFPRG